MQLIVGKLNLIENEEEKLKMIEDVIKSLNSLSIRN